MPFRVIIEDKGSWQRVTVKFLQRCHQNLPIDDRLLIRDSAELVEFLNNCPLVTCSCVDVKDLFWNVPQPDDCLAVQEKIDTCGCGKFQNSCG
ncbi:hypothetical protein MTO96_045176, partial [Rhipicephalus appendiculatus]